MPFIRVVYSGDKEVKDDIAKAISSAASAALNKPEAVFMVHVIHDDSLLFGGSKEPAGMIQIEAIGGEITNAITPLTEILSSIGGVLPSRVFINYQTYTADNWTTHGVTVQHYYEHQHST